MLGATNPLASAPGTIRGDYAYVHLEFQFPFCPVLGSRGQDDRLVPYTPDSAFTFTPFLLLIQAERS